MLLGFLCVQVVDVRDYLTLMDDKGILRHDHPAPDGDVGKAIRDKVAASNEDTVEVCICTTVSSSSSFISALNIGSNTSHIIVIQQC